MHIGIGVKLIIDLVLGLILGVIAGIAATYDGIVKANELGKRNVNYIGDNYKKGKLRWLTYKKHDN